jgi:hypothetical protein
LDHRTQDAQEDSSRVVHITITKPADKARTKVYIYSQQYLYTCHLFLVPRPRRKESQSRPQTSHTCCSPQIMTPNPSICRIPHYDQPSLARKSHLCKNPNDPRPLEQTTVSGQKSSPYPSDSLYSRKVNKLVCKMFIALSALRASMTHEMLISLAPKHP